MASLATVAKTNAPAGTGVDRRIAGSSLVITRDPQQRRLDTDKREEEGDRVRKGVFDVIPNSQHGTSYMTDR